MNLHKSADEMVAALGGLYGDGTKFFREGTDSLHLSEVIAETGITPSKTPAPLELAEGREVTVQAAFGPFSAPARFTVLRWTGPQVPTLIHHHGSGESDYTARIRRIARRMYDSPGPEPGMGGPVNIIACSVPYNHNLKEYLYGAARLDRWVFLLAASVRLTEALVARLRELGRPHIACAGISLGGWITNLHHTYFDTCDVYSPIFAGAALDDLFTESIYRKLLASSARDAGARFREALNFEQEFTARGNENVYPVMARFDQFIRFERQAGVYRPEQMTVLERGHTTGAIAYRRLAGHLAHRLFPTSGSDTADKSATNDVRLGGSA
ncbi:MAG: hypothetical protein GVY14_14350 [Spirochaetes bacterium]|jgi:hypothetical protein|nr:hypothetical protein [Spirochaetota bacterium]